MAAPSISLVIANSSNLSKDSTPTHITLIIIDKASSTHTSTNTPINNQTIFTKCNYSNNTPKCITNGVRCTDSTAE